MAWDGYLNEEKIMTTSSIEVSEGFTSIIRRHQLLVFVVLAYAFSWWPWIWYQYDPIAADAPILPIGPFLAALIVTAICGGRAAIAEWLKKILHWRVGWGWFLFALLLPAALTLASVGLNLWAGGKPVPGFQFPDAGSFAFRFIFIFFWIALGEEPAWRGFALPKLLDKYRAIVAAVALGVIHLVWHAPLYSVEYNPANVLPWAISVVCVSVVICWVYLNTNGSLLLPMLLHASNNTIALLWRMFSGDEQLRLWWIWCVLWVATTLAVVAWSGFGLQGRLEKNT